jgi:hypothetical protein
MFMCMSVEEAKSKVTLKCKLLSKIYCFPFSYSSAVLKAVSVLILGEPRDSN